MAEAPVSQGQSCVSLEDVCLYFTEEEWDLLSDAQKLLYHNVMLETFSLLLSLGLPISKSFPGSRLTGDILTHNALSGTMRCPLPSLLKVLPSLQNKQRKCIKRAQLRAECTSKQEPLGDSSDESRFQ